MKRHTKSLIDLIDQTPPIGRFKTLVGAEIGVWTGRNAALLLGAFPELVLHGIDDYRGCPSGKITGGEAMAAAWQLLSPFGTRYIRINRESKKAAITFGKVFDFIFIDASHDYESVKQDIALWAPKVRRDGLIAGHDYSRRHKGVIRAVDEAYAAQGYDVAPGKVWWVVKE